MSAQLSDPLIRWSVAGVLMVALLSAGCSSRTVKTTAPTPVIQETEEIAEELLLDVGIMTFNPGLDKVKEGDEDSVVFPEIRKAESRYMPYLLMETLQTSAGWGAVRVIPSDNSVTDIVVDGEIVSSDGVNLVVKVTVKDATGKLWFTREYEGLASSYSYNPKYQIETDPFQDIYNRIANDMLNYRRSLTAPAITNVRTVAELKFARNFSPDSFDGHLTQSKDGLFQVNRLPSEGDPMLTRIRRIRERDYMFVDTLQEYYGTFAKEMSAPYKQWRSMSYEEVLAMEALKRSAMNNTIAGAVAIIGGIAAANSSSGSARAAGQVGVLAGGYLIKDGMDKRSEAKIHVEALQELGDSLEASIQPQVIELEDRTITLTGTVENQYDQWRELLREIYQLDTGLTESDGDKN